MDEVNIDVDKIQEQNKANEELHFQDFPHDSSFNSEKKAVQTHTFTDFPHTAESDEEEVYDKEQLLKETKDKAAPSFWTFEYYQQFFDIETHQVLGRILGSFVPRPKSNYIADKIRPNPDLYGPFWICTTLVFTTAIAGNLANYLGSGGKDYHWKYDFHKVTFAATAIFSYWWVIPTALFGVLWWRGSKAGYSYLEILCVYGYSLAIYIPISILWVIQFNWFQWILVIVGALLSGGVLMLTFWPAVKEDNKRVAVGIIVAIFIFHALLAVGFKLYFFHVPVAQVGQSTISPVTSKLPLTTQNPNMVNKPQGGSTPVLKNFPAQQAGQGQANKGPLPVAQTQKAGTQVNEKTKRTSPKSSSNAVHKKEKAKRTPQKSLKKSTNVVHKKQSRSIM